MRISLRIIQILQCVSILMFICPVNLMAEPERGCIFTPTPGLIDIRSTYSDGTHTIEELAGIAISRGFKILFINDHDQIALSYGIPPFRNIFRYKRIYPSIISNSAEDYLAEIERVSEKYPEILIIPGCETSAYYYWKGSWFKDNLTVNQYDRRMLIINLTRPGDYEQIPNMPYRFSCRYTIKLLPGTLFFVIPLLAGIILIKWKGFARIMGYTLTIISILAIIDYNPFRSSLFNPYKGDQGIAPYQELINYVNEKGGLCIWNYPEQKSGIRRHGPINAVTPPYPQVLYESKNYTGFSAIYGEFTTVTDPGREWDRVLKEYCSGKREKPVWGVSTADFHEDGRLNQRLGAFPTTFLIKEFTKAGILDAIKNGRMYCSRGDGKVWPVLDHFNVTGSKNKTAFMGDALITNTIPVINFKVSYNDKVKRPVKIELIRGGELINSYKGKTPLEVKLMDNNAPKGVKTYYRLRDTKEHLVSNPVFVVYKP
jgi:hypothetical protein